LVTKNSLMSKSLLTVATGFLAFTGILLYTFYVNNFSILFIWALFGYIGIKLSRRLDKTERVKLVELFIFSFCFYTVYMLITNYILVKNPTSDFFYAIDSTKFWKNAKAADNIDDIFNQFKRSATGWGGSQEYRLFNFMCLVLAYIASFIGENHIVIQKLQGVFLGALSIPYIFLILKKFTDSNYSYKCTLFFSVFSLVSTFAVVFSRDITVYFIYTLATYLFIFREKEIRNLIFLIILVPITYFIRFEHGIFLCSYVAAYLYMIRERNKKVIIPIIFLIPVAIYLAVPFASVVLSTYSNYSDKTQEAAGETDSLAAAFGKLPFGIKQIFLGFLSQTAPIPFWRNLVYSGTDVSSVPARSHTYLRFMESLSGTAWIYVWGIIIINTTKSIFWSISKELKLLLAISIVLILATTADIQVRRVFCVYPSIFIFSMVVFYQRTLSRRKVSLIRITSFIIILYSVYIVLKS
jgi:hypothetical protein